MKATERCKILKEKNKELRSLLLQIKRDLNYLKKQKYESTTALVLIGARINAISEATQNTGKGTNG